MHNFSKDDTARVFARYAGRDVAKWQTIRGCTVMHKDRERGPGLIVSVTENSPGEMRLKIAHRITADMEVTIKQYNVTAANFSRFFPQLSLPPELDRLLDDIRAQIRDEAARQAILEQQQKEAFERAQQAERERERARQEERRDTEKFAELKVRYQAEDYPESFPTSPLYPLLLRLDEGGPFIADDWNWLARKRLHATLARYRSAAFDHTGNPWHLTAASSAWRNAGQPDKAFALTDLLLTMPHADDKRQRAAILTTRGGALCDLDRLDEAEACAWEAVRCDEKSYFPHNLLGRVYIRLARPDLGEHHFNVAISLGSDPQDTARQIEYAMRQSSAEEQMAVATHFWKKDPMRYQWAQRYLR